MSEMSLTTSPMRWAVDREALHVGIRLGDLMHRLGGEHGGLGDALADFARARGELFGRPATLSTLTAVWVAEPASSRVSPLVREPSPTSRSRSASSSVAAEDCALTYCSTPPRTRPRSRASAACAPRVGLGVAFASASSAFALDEALAEHLDRLDHAAELVLAPTVRQHRLDVAAGELAMAPVRAADRARCPSGR